MHDPELHAREERAPLWARLAPALYLLVCAGCVRSALADRSLEIGLSGLLVAIGFVASFAIPAIFATRACALAASSEGLTIDGRLVKSNDRRLTRAARGGARLEIEERGGQTRVFFAPSYADAQRLVARLPPPSAPRDAVVA